MNRHFRSSAVAVAVAAIVTTASALAQVRDAAKPPPRDQIVVEKTKVEVFNKKKVVIKKAPAKKAVVRKIEVRPAPPAVPAPMIIRMAPGAVIAGGLDPQIQQYTQQFLPIIRSELHLLRSVCPMSDDQRKEMTRVGARVLKETAKACAEAQQKLRGGIRANQMPLVNAPKLIQEGLAKAAREHLSAEAADRYQKETASLAEDQKHTTILAFIVRFDRELMLTAEQRDRLSKTLEAHWNDSWNQWSQVLTYNEQFVPNVPDPCISPVLTEEQKKIWRGAQKYGGVSWIVGFTGGPYGGLGALEDDGLDEALRAESEPEPDAAQPERPRAEKRP